MSMRLFEKARQKSLADFATSNGFTLRKQGLGYAGKRCPHCAEGGNDALSLFPKDGVWRWNCFRCRRGGTVVDFAAAVWGSTEMEAAMRLANDGSGFLSEQPVAAPAPHRPSSLQTQGALKDALTALLKGGYTRVTEAVEYLASRGIGEETIHEATRRGMLRFLPNNPHEANKMLAERVGMEKLVAAGFVREGKSWPAIAFRPLVFFFPGQEAAEFRLARAPKEGEPKAIRYGQTKWPWWWKHGKSAETVYIVEGAIDVLSMVELGLKEGDAVLGMPGTTSWKPEWFHHIHRLYPNARFILALDSDQAGQDAAKGISKVLEELRVPIMEVAPEGKDWNEHLQAIKAAEQRTKVA